MMMKEALENVEEGIRVGGYQECEICRLSRNGCQFGSRITELDGQPKYNSENYDLKINIKKTKAMVVSRNGGQTVNITVEGQSVEQVSKFKYLGSLISEDGRCLDDVKTRIGMAKDAFNKRKAAN